MEVRLATIVEVSCITKRLMVLTTKQATLNFSIIISIFINIQRLVITRSKYLINN